ncbi:hypothetical protein MRX96_017560 [Rhipicephalus microplus]
MVAAAYTALAKSMSQCRSHTEPQAWPPGSGAHGGGPGGLAPGADDVVSVLCVIVLPQRISYDDCLGTSTWRIANRAVAVLAILGHRYAKVIPLVDAEVREEIRSSTPVVHDSSREKENFAVEEVVSNNDGCA